MRRTAVVVLAFFCLLDLGAGPAAAQPAPQRAPTIARTDPGAGFVPPALELSHLVLPAVSPAKARDLPARHDWREQGQVSPAKDQGSCGSCYAFAAVGDLESRVLRDWLQLVDLSENQVKECHYEANSCNGGNAQIAMNLLTLRGASLESCDPYVAADVACDLGCEPGFAVLAWHWLSGGLQPATADLKQALLDHGPLSTTVYAGDSSNPSWWQTFTEWDGGPGLYYAGGEQTNHAVMLVGWDDDQPHAGGGAGCWIVKNSWGASWGDVCGYGSAEGYCYLAYGSAGFGKWSSAIVELMPSYPELTVAAWDEGGWTGAYGYNQTAAWGLARHTVPDETNLHRVEFWTTDATVDVDVYVYADFDGTTLGGLLASALNRSFPAAGYHSVELTSPLALSPGVDYYVAVRFQNASYVYPVAIDGQGSRGAGHTWLSYSGSAWVDLGGTANCEAGIRIRTSPHATLAVEDPGSPPAPGAPHAARFELAAPWPNPFNPSTNVAFTLGAAARVRLRIHDLQGRALRTLVDAALDAGRHQEVWDGRDDAGRSLPAGVYVCRLDDGWQSRSQRVVLIK
ncbi:MAG TPA: C1 family peptidase [Candidatus Krumholzibacteria bacterium]|nr:C1 family peptidase [Candidatus Krumholzibacteria bacterium]HPD72263.1 C1 family peptidase [Candidatus Krumholzibacteria bacterium]HRY40805.1 C1 family peptidase [Candidatus Krumholzibacteria bacterium]